MNRLGTQPTGLEPDPDPSALAAHADGELIRRIRRRTADLLRQATALCSTHRATPPDPQIRFDLRGRAAGQAVWLHRKKQLLRFNLDIARTHADDFVHRTVAHEVAHLIAIACHGRVQPHGREWRQIMRFLGIHDPRRCHDYVVDESRVKRQRRWTYVCACSKHQLSTTRHNRVRDQLAHYRCRRCGEVLRMSRAAGD